MLLRRLAWLGLLPAAGYFYYHVIGYGTFAASIAHYALQFFFLLLATLSIASAASHKSNTKIARYWGQLAGGLGIWCLTTVLEVLEILMRQPRYGTVADGFWIMGYLVLLGGMHTGASFFGAYSTKTAMRVGMNWLLFAAVVLGIVLIFLKPEAGSVLVLLIACFYHVADALLVFWALIAVYGNNAGASKPALRLVLYASVLFYSFNLVVILQQFTAPLHFWSAAAFSTAYFFLYLAGLRAVPSPYQAQGRVIK